MHPQPVSVLGVTLMPCTPACQITAGKVGRLRAGCQQACIQAASCDDSVNQLDSTCASQSPCAGHGKVGGHWR